MTREEARNNAEVMAAYAQGKKIEVLCDDGEWGEIEEPDFDFMDFKYRVKKEPSYRQFRNTKECFEEMKKHKPFGCVRLKGENTFNMISSVCNGEIIILGETIHFDFAFNYVLFADGEPFGIKE